MKSNTNKRSWVIMHWKSNVCFEHIEKHSMNEFFVMARACITKTSVCISTTAILIQKTMIYKLSCSTIMIGFLFILPKKLKYHNQTNYIFAVCTTDPSMCFSWNKKGCISLTSMCSNFLDQFALLLYWLIRPKVLRNFCSQKLTAPFLYYSGATQI
jgi:hypothetical protein